MLCTNSSTNNASIKSSSRAERQSVLRPGFDAAAAAAMYNTGIISTTSHIQQI